MTEPTNSVRAAYRLAGPGATRANPGVPAETRSDAPLDRPGSLLRVDLPEELLDRLEASRSTTS